MKGAREVPRPGRKAVTVRLADVEPEEVSWLWRPYIPLGKFTLLEGDPGLGKTFIALTLCAIITRGWPMPGQDGAPGDEHEPANVLYLSAEDGLGDTLRPRLDAAGADVSRVIALTGWQETDTEGKVIEGMVTLGDKEMLEQALEEHHPKLVVIDPLQAYLGADADMHKANEVRPRLAMLSALAEKYGCAVLCIRHWTKGNAAKSIYRGLGSIDFTAAARSVLVVGEHEGQRLLAQVKSNLAPFGKSQRYRLEGNALMWLGVSEVTAEDLNIQVQPESDGVLEDAVTFLEGFLKDAPQTAQQVTRAAKDEGISTATLRRAKAGLGVLSLRENTGEERGKGKWLWGLPTQDAQGEHEGSSPPKEKREHLEHLEGKADGDAFLQDAQGIGDEHLEQAREGRENFNMFKVLNASNRGSHVETGHAGQPVDNPPRPPVDNPPRPPVDNRFRDYTPLFDGEPVDNPDDDDDPGSSSGSAEETPWGEPEAEGEDGPWETTL